MICSGHGGILINFNIASQLGGPAAQCLEVDQHRKRAGYPTGCINRSKPSTSRQSCKYIRIENVLGSWYLQFLSKGPDVSH